MFLNVSLMTPFRDDGEKLQEKIVTGFGEIYT
jgi:hypothetical protein